MNGMEENRIKSFLNRFSEITNRLELIKLEQEIRDYMQTEEYSKLPETKKDELDKILMEILNKKEYFKTGCDPWKKILGEI